MRIDHLHLVRYGHFQDTRLSFPRAAKDLHLLVGENEAGKTTLRKAVLDWLFGIHPQSTMNIGYEKSMLSIAGQLSAADGKTLEFLRRKAVKLGDSLRDMTNNTLPLAVLDPFLPAALKREAFERMFCMGTQELRDGVDALMDSNNDDPFARVLWQSTSGIPGLHSLEKMLISEAEALYEPGGRKKGGRRYDDAAKRLEEHRQAIKERTVSASTYDAARKMRESAAKDLAGVQSQQKELRSKQAKLQRVRATAGDWDEYQRLDQDLQARSPVPAVAADAELRVSGAMTAVSQHLADRDREAGQEATERAAANLLTLPGNLEARLDGVAVIARDQKSAEDALRDLPGVQGTHDRNTEAAKSKARSAGFAGQDLESLRAWLPGTLQRKAAREVIDLIEGAETAAREAHAKAEQRRQDLVELKSKFDALPVVADVRALGEARTALSAATLDPQQGRDLERLRERFNSALRALGAFATSLEAVNTLQLPSLAEAREYEAARTRLDSQRDAAETTLNKLNEDLAAADARILRAKAKARLSISPEALKESRNHRDALWMEIRQSPSQVQTHGEVFEQAIHGADEVADARFAHSDAAHELEAATVDRDIVADRVVKQCVSVDSARGAAQSHRDQWAARLAVQGLKPLGEADLQALLKSIDSLRDQHHTIQEKMAAIDARKDANAGARQAIITLLGMDGSDESLLSSAQRRIDDANHAAGERKTLSTQITAKQAELRGLDAQVQLRDEDLENARGRGRTSFSAAGLVVDVDTALARNQLAVMSEVEVQLDALADTDLRINQMKAAISAFRAVVRQALGLFEMPDTGDVLADARKLRPAADDLRARQIKRDQHLKTADSALANVNKAIAGIDAAKASVAELMAQTGSEKIEQLMTVVAEAARQRDLRGRLDELRQKMVQAAGGVSFETVTAEIDESDRASLSSELDAIDHELTAINQTLISAAQADKEASDKLLAMGKGDELVKSEVQRQMALAEMREAVDRFSTVRGAAEILRWALRRYRQQAQGPMLETASTMFSKMTLGRYRGLTIDLDAPTPELLAVLANSGRHVQLDHLSEGTRQPLFLALRLASIALYLKERPGMMFIADDLFVDLDDERAAAGFDVLGEIATRGQVFYLTHHHHLEPVARRAVPAVQVTTLRRPADLVPAS